MKKVAIHNLGCKVNSYEAESMEQMLIQAGYQIVPFNENISADVYIINTCSVTNIADRKSRQMLHKAKKMNPEAIVIAAGCYAQADSEHLEEDNAVDIVLGNNCKSSIVEVIEEFHTNQDTNNTRIIDFSDEQPFEELEIARVNEHTRAYIKIQDGCNQFCSYCIIPYVRGRIRSRAMKDIIAEVERLVANGYQEIVLTGIHLASYGKDNGQGSLLDVLVALNKIEGLKRIRMGSLEPNIVTEEFVKTISSMDKICPHFHLSLQSGCDRTLQAMNRKYTTTEYEQGCNLLRKYFDHPAITTDVIVGFPGETQEDFQITEKFLENIHFYEMHIFKYSRRKGTVADTMPNQVDESVKGQRSAQLLDLAKNMTVEYLTYFENHQCDILIEEKINQDGREYFTGFTKNYMKAVIPADQFDESASPINTIVEVQFTRVDTDRLMIEADLLK